MFFRRTHPCSGRTRLVVLLLWFCATVPFSVTAAAAGTEFDPAEASIFELQVAMGTGQLTAAALVEFYLERIRRLDPVLNAVARTNPDALRIAEMLDAERVVKGPRGPLHGIPLLVRDNYQTADMPTTAGSLLLAGFQPAADAYQIAKLRAAGAIILGKTNMHEFALGITAEGSGFGRSRNPYAPGRNPGDGLAAAVAANLGAAGLGTDTCGALRISAAHNNLYGLRPTQGLSSRAGLIPVSHTQDAAGPVARNVVDLALLLDVTAGFDPEDPQTALSQGHSDEPYISALRPAALQGARIGVLEDLLLLEPDDAEVAAVAGAAIAGLQAAGARLERISAPELIALMDSRVNGLFVLEYEFSTDFQAYLQRHPDAPVRSIEDVLASGEHDPSVDAALRLAAAMDQQSQQEYLAELKHRELLRRVVLGIMAANDLDALVYPAVRRKAQALGQMQPGSNCRLAANTGLPALVIPAGFTQDGLPVGLELLGSTFSERRLLALAYSYQQMTRSRRQPPIDAAEPGAVPGVRDPDALPAPDPDPEAAIEQD